MEEDLYLDPARAGRSDAGMEEGVRVSGERAGA